MPKLSSENNRRDGRLLGWGDFVSTSVAASTIMIFTMIFIFIIIIYIRLPPPPYPLSPSATPFSSLLPLELTRSAFACAPSFQRKHFIPLRDGLLHSFGITRMRGGVAAWQSENSVTVERKHTIISTNHGFLCTMHNDYNDYNAMTTITTMTSETERE